MVGYLFGGNTGRTYEQLQEQRRHADAIAAKLMDKTPTTTAGGIGALLTGIGVGIGRYRTDKSLKEASEKSASGFEGYLRDRLMGNPTDGSPYASAQPLPSSGSTIPMTGAASEVAATSPTTGDTYAPFMDTIKAGGVNNPYALAAIAATGRAESGWDGKKAVSTWSDPSESGQAGTSGGIMSWRGPRYAALAATGDLSPQGQANFFLKEDPELIARLNSAQSLEEAQGLMNGAWKFAGYNRAGGESSRRLGYAKGYLSNFQGSGTEVASLDPSAGMSAADAIETVAPQSGYRDPMVSAPNFMPTAQPQPQMQPGNMALPTLPQSGPMPQQRPQEVAQAGNGYFPAAPQPPTAATAPRPAPAQNNAADIGQLMRWANDPFLQPEMRAQAQLLLQQELRNADNAREEQQWRARQDYQTQQQRNDPLYQLKLDAARTEAANGKRQPLVNAGDGQIYDPNKGEWIAQPNKGGGNGQFRYDGNSVEAQSLNGLMDSGKLTPEQAQQLGAGKTVTGPDGSQYFMTPEGLVGSTPATGTNSQAQGVDIFAGTPNAPVASTSMPAPASPAPLPAQSSSAVPGGIKIGGAKPPSGYQWNDPADQSAGMTPIAGGPGEEISAEVAARIGLADNFLGQYSSMRNRLSEGLATGLLDRAQAGMNQSSDQAQLYREMESGTDALMRMLTGAGMNETEARSYARRYLPTYTDNAASAVKKLDQLKSELESTRAMVLRGRGNMPSPAGTVPQGNGASETPAGISADVWSVMTPEERALWTK